MKEKDLYLTERINSEMVRDSKTMRKSNLKKDIFNSQKA